MWTVGRPAFSFHPCLFSATGSLGPLSGRLMQPYRASSANTSRSEQCQDQLATWPCKSSFVEQHHSFCQESPDLSAQDCCSQPGSSVSACSNEMSSSTEGHVQLEESDLQCEERNHFLSSPQDSDTSAFSYQDLSRYFSPMLPLLSQAASTPPRRLLPIFEVSGQPTSAEVPADAIWETMSVVGTCKHESLCHACCLGCCS